MKTHLECFKLKNNNNSKSKEQIMFALTIRTFFLPPILLKYNHHFSQFQVLASFILSKVLLILSKVPQRNLSKSDPIPPFSPLSSKRQQPQFNLARNQTIAKKPLVMVVEPLIHQSQCSNMKYPIYQRLNVKKGL